MMKAQASRHQPISRELVFRASSDVLFQREEEVKGCVTPFTSSSQHKPAVRLCPSADLLSSFLADMVIDSMLASGQLEDGAQEKVREAMLRRHHHQNEKKLSNRIPLVRSFADIGKKYSEPNLLERNGETAALLSSSRLQASSG